MDPYVTPSLLPFDLTSALWLIVLASSLTWGIAGALLADHKGEVAWKWYLVGALLGPLGLALLAIMPPKPKS